MEIKVSFWSFSIICSKSPFPLTFISIKVLFFVSHSSRLGVFLHLILFFFFEYASLYLKRNVFVSFVFADWNVSFWIEYSMHNGIWNAKFQSFFFLTYLGNFHSVHFFLSEEENFCYCCAERWVVFNPPSNSVHWFPFFPFLYNIFSFSVFFLGSVLGPHKPPNVIAYLP